MKKRKMIQWLWFMVLFFAALSPCSAADNIRIVTTTSTLADLTRQITGDQTAIYYIASPRQNIHFISPSPKDVLKVKKADVFIHGGLDLEAWREPLLNAAGNLSFLGDSKASIDASKGILLLEIPSSLSRSEGDIHAFGNPHYWTDPHNALIMVDNIVAGLSGLYPQDAPEFQKNAAAYKQKLSKKISEWEKRMEPFKGETLVTYHKSWPYFANRFHLKIIDQLEPKPGIPPTSKHLAEVERKMNEDHTKIIVKEIYNESRTPKKVARDTGAAVVTLETSAGEQKDAPDYISMMEHNIHELETEFSKKES